MAESLTLTEDQHIFLKKNLFPGDGCESAAILLCRFVGLSNNRLIVTKIINVPDEECSKRTPTLVSWPGKWLLKAAIEARIYSDAVILAHSHPTGMFEFSKTDDISNSDSMPTLFAAVEGDGFYHGSAIMMPGGAMKIRLFTKDHECKYIDRIMCVGHSIKDISTTDTATLVPFTSEMRDLFKKKTACIIGVSGTGSLTVEQLARKGVGHLILIDFDEVEHKNLNRIINSTVKDADDNRSKIEMMKDSIARYNPDIKVTCIRESIKSREAIIAASSADIIFSCMDTLGGRRIAEAICRCCLIPLIDMAVNIEVKSNKEIADICGRVDYVRPDGPNLSDRGIITPQGLANEHRFEFLSDKSEESLKDNYLHGFLEKNPSVMALNMRAASDAVMEWLSRQFPYRYENESYSQTRFSFVNGRVRYKKEKEFSYNKSLDVGRGFIKPLLNKNDVESLP